MTSKGPSKRDNNLTFYINLNASRREINCRPNDPTASFVSGFFFHDNVWRLKQSISRKIFMTVISYFPVQLTTLHGSRLFQGQYVLLRTFWQNVVVADTRTSWKIYVL